MKHFKVYRFYDPGDAENGPRLEEEFVSSYDTLEEAQPHAGDGFRIEEADAEDDTMELYAHLYSLMDDVEKSIWSRKHADDVLADQRRYEIDHGITPREYDALDFYETIAEFIAQDEGDDD